jgi:hypothetical protein
MPKGSWFYVSAQMLVGLRLIPKSAEKLRRLKSQESFHIIVVASDTNGEGAVWRGFENERKNRVIKKGCKIRRNDYIGIVTL